MNIFIWKSENPRRYATAYAINKMEAQTTDGVLVIPKCERAYKRIKKRLYGVFHARCLESFYWKLADFEKCIKFNYPEVYNNYTNLKAEASTHYHEVLKNSKYKERLDMTRKELDQMYKRAEERLARIEAEKKKEAEARGEKYEPPKEPGINGTKKMVEKATGHESSKFKSMKIF